MRILHTEASPGWGGQEIRILREACGMRERGHELYFVVQKGGGLVEPLRKEGFIVYELSFSKAMIPITFGRIVEIATRHRIDLINTHSSMDSWIGGIAGRMLLKRVVRTRHLSTPIRGGMNGKLLYNTIPDYVVTTCEEVVAMIQERAKIPAERCSSVPTGVDPEMLAVNPVAVADFRKKLGLNEEDVLAGTCCILRGWKGVKQLLDAAKILENEPNLHWVVVGGGVSEEYFREIWRSHGLEKRVHFTGHLDNPATAIAAMDIFLLLSWANEGVSQASLQAAYLGKPLITTAIGGLKEVCLHEKTGLIVAPQAEKEVAEAVKRLMHSASLREKMGCAAKDLALSNFLFSKTLDKMEAIYGCGK